jgi:DNA replication protein DnaC
MSVQANKDLLRALKLKGMLDEYDAEVQSGQFDSLPFDERLNYLLCAEESRKRDNRTRNRHNKAHFAQADACIEDILYDADRGLDKATILRLASCEYVSRHENILILGASDSGKTYLGCAIGGAACRRGIKVCYSRLTEVFSILANAEKDGKYLKKFREYATVPVLLLDDFMLTTPTIKEVQILIELCERREFSGSTIVCSQMHPSDWQKRIDEKIQANAIYSRLVPSAHEVTIKGGRPMRERVSQVKK